MFGKQLKAGVNLGTRKSLADIAVTAAAYFDLEHRFPGDSFLADIMETIN